MSHCDVFHPCSVTKMHHPPCCSLCTPSIHSSSMPISASYVLLPSDLMTTPSLHHLSPPPHLSFSPNALPAFLSFFLQPYNFTHALSTPPSFALVSFFHLFISSHVSTIHSPTQPPFSLPVCSDRFCGSRAGNVNVKPFPAMIMFIARCVSRCPWINTN